MERASSLCFPLILHVVQVLLRSPALRSCSFSPSMSCPRKAGRESRVSSEAQHTTRPSTFGHAAALWQNCTLCDRCSRDPQNQTSCTRPLACRISIGTPESNPSGRRICSVLGTPTTANWPDGFKLASQTLGKHPCRVGEQSEMLHWRFRINYRFPQFVPTKLETLVPQSNADGIGVMLARA